MPVPVERLACHRGSSPSVAFLSSATLHGGSETKPVVKGIEVGLKKHIGASNCMNASFCSNYSSHVNAGTLEQNSHVNLLC